MLKRRESSESDASDVEQEGIKRRKLLTKSSSDLSTIQDDEWFKDQKLQQALFKFKKTSEKQIKVMTSQGLDSQAAINILLDKLRSENGPFLPKDEEINLVMKIAGFTRIDALRALIVRDELVKLRRNGLQGVEAVDELIERMRGLNGTKRKSEEIFYEQSFSDEEFTVESDLFFSSDFGHHDKKPRNSFEITSPSGSSSEPTLNQSTSPVDTGTQSPQHPINFSTSSISSPFTFGNSNGTRNLFSTHSEKEELSPASSSLSNKYIPSKRTHQHENEPLSSEEELYSGDYEEDEFIGGDDDAFPPKKLKPDVLFQENPESL